MPKTILAVDDDPFILLVVEKFLVSKGYKVVGMTDPEKAYFWAEKNKPDLIISDVAMPESSQLRIRQSRQQTGREGRIMRSDEGSYGSTASVPRCPR